MASVLLRTVLLKVQNRIVNLLYSGSTRAIGRSAGIQFYTTNTYIVPEVAFPANSPPTVGNFIQIGLMSVTQPNARSGEDLMLGTFRIAVFRRSNLDEQTTAIDRITAIGGLLYVLEDLEQYFPESYLEGTLVIGCHLVVGSAASGQPTEIAPGWIMGYRDFSFGITSNIPSQAVKLDGTTPDNGT